MTFRDLGLSDAILSALQMEGYSNPTPIQEQAIPILLNGRDLLGCAQTGTGKTAAFALPILNQMARGQEPRKGQRKVRALIIAPTRELALQVGESFSRYGKFTNLRNAVIFGGVNQRSQTRALDRGVDIVIGTPGRLLDLMGQGHLSLRHIEHFVLDEADHMLDMGFIHDIKKIIAQLPQRRQSLFFSATMSYEIRDLADRILGDPESITIQPERKTADRVEQAVYFVSKKGKRDLLVHVLETEQVDSALIFSRTKHGADKLVRHLDKAGIRAAAIHGNKSQAARQKVLGRFKSGSLNVLVATDIAARGIDVDELSHVINYDLPNVPETYVHRIGRTGRAQASGVALSFCDQEEKAFLKSIQRLIAQNIPVVHEHPFPDDTPEVSDVPKKKSGGNRNRGGNRNFGGGGNRNQNGGAGGNRNKRRRPKSSRRPSSNS